MKKIASVVLAIQVFQVFLPTSAHAVWLWDWTVGWVYDDKNKVIINPITTAKSFLGYHTTPNFTYNPEAKNFSNKLYIESAKFDIRSNKDYALAFEIDYAVKMYQGHVLTGQIDVSSLQNHMNGIHREFIRLKALTDGEQNNNPFKGSVNESAEIFFKAVKNVPGILGEIAGPTGQLANYLLKVDSYLYDRLIAPHDQMMGQMKLFDKTQEFEQLADNALGTMRNIAFYDGGFAKFMTMMTHERIHAPLLGDSQAIINDPYNQWFKNAYAMSALLPYIKHDGVQMSEEQARFIINSINQELKVQIHKSIIAMNELTLKIGRLKEAIAHGQPPSDIDRLQREREEYQLRIQRNADIARNTLGGAAAVFNIVSLAFPNNSETGLRVREFGRASITITSAIMDFCANLSNENLQSTFQNAMSGALRLEIS